MIKENGIGCVDQLSADGKIHDDYRIAYLRDHILEMNKAVDDGVDLIGYMAWGCLDLISVSTGEMKKMCIRDSSGTAQGRTAAVHT